MPREARYPYLVMEGVRAARCSCSEDEMPPDYELVWITDSHCPEHGEVQLPRAPLPTYRNYLPPGVVALRGGFRTIHK